MTEVFIGADIGTHQASEDTRTAALPTSPPVPLAGATDNRLSGSGKHAVLIAYRRIQAGGVETMPTAALQLATPHSRSTLAIRCLGVGQGLLSGWRGCDPFPPCQNRPPLPLFPHANDNTPAPDRPSLCPLWRCA